MIQVIKPFLRLRLPLIFVVTFTIGKITSECFWLHLGHHPITLQAIGYALWPTWILGGVPSVFITAWLMYPVIRYFHKAETPSSIQADVTSEKDGWPPPPRQHP